MELQTNVKTGDLKISEGTTTVTAPVQPVEEKKPDLVTRVSQFKAEEKVEVSKEDKASNEFGLTREDWDRVQSDPSLKKYYNSMLADYTKKTSSVSEKERKLQEETKKSSTWTPGRIKELLNDPAFVQSAQQVAQEQPPSNFKGTQEEWSAMSDTDKIEFQNLKNEINSLKQQNFVQQLKQQDEGLKTKYANYNPEAVDIITDDLLRGKVQATSESLWKVLDYDEAVR